MKLQGIILPASLAVSMPTIVPAGALEATCKLLIVIVMNLSGGAISLSKTNVGYRSWSIETGPPSRRSIDMNLGICLVYTIYILMSI